MNLRRHRSVLLALLPSLISCLAGCVEAPPQPLRSAELAEPAWEEQVQQVRAGEATEVRLVARPVSPEQWQMLQEDCQSLEVLEVDSRRLAADDLQLLADRLPALQRLRLTGPVDDSQLQKIAAAAGLKMLNLPEGVFTDAGMQHLAELKDLELLRFGSPHVSDDGLAVVSKLPSRSFLHLINVPLTDAGLEHLHPMSGLESFYLDGGRCTDEGLYALLRALPGLHFHRDQLHLADDPHAHPHEAPKAGH